MLCIHYKSFGIYVCYSWLIIFLQPINLVPLSKVRTVDPNHIEEVVRDVHKRFSQMRPRQGMENQGFLLIVILPKLFGSHSAYLLVHPQLCNCLGCLLYICVCVPISTEKIKRPILQFLIMLLPKPHISSPNKQYRKNIALEINFKVLSFNIVRVKFWFWIVQSFIGT